MNIAIADGSGVVTAASGLAPGPPTAQQSLENWLVMRPSRHSVGESRDSHGGIAQLHSKGPRSDFGALAGSEDVSSRKCAGPWGIASSSGALTGVDAPLLVPDVPEEDLDPEVMAALPDHIRRELRLAYMARFRRQSSGPTPSGGKSSSGEQSKGAKSEAEMAARGRGLDRFLVPNSAKRPKR